MHLVLSKRVSVWSKLAAGAFAVFCVFALGSSAHAMTCTFASVGTSDWNTAGNWDCGWVPTSTTDVVIPASTSTNMSATSYASSVTIGVGSILDFNSKWLNLYGNWVDNGSTAHSLLQAEGSSNQTIGADNTISYFLAHKTGGAVATLVGDLTVGTFEANAGTVDANGYNVTVTGSGTGFGRPFQATLGTFLPNYGQVFYTGSGDTDIEPIVYADLNFTGSGPYNITASTTATGQVT